MLDFYYLGKDFVDVLSDLGSYLVEYNIDDLCTYLSTTFDLPDLFDLFLNNVSLLIGNFTIASLIFGSGLVFILIFKIVKFFTDIVL